MALNDNLVAKLDDLVYTYETEVNYKPIEVVLDKEKTNFSEADLPALYQFLENNRKCLFLFTIPGDEASTTKLQIRARRAVLTQSANTVLQSVSLEPKINPLKLALSDPDTRVTVGIQIQQSFKPDDEEDSASDLKRPSESLSPRDASAGAETFNDPDFKAFPEIAVLQEQMSKLGMKLSPSADKIIRDNKHAFTDGLVLNNLPKGLFVDSASRRLLAYNTKLPMKAPTALAPTFGKPAALEVPHTDIVAELYPNIDNTLIQQLLNDKDQPGVKKALTTILTGLNSVHSKEILTYYNGKMKQSDKDLLAPILAKQLLLGGEAHACLLSRLLKKCQTSNISLDFLRMPETQDALLSARGMKNLEKLTKLTAEQRSWWNTLCEAHLAEEKNIFDFNTFFEAYTQIFLPKIADLELTLPNPCPIKQTKGHMLVTLNRVLDVLALAKNSQEQCQQLEGLNWGPLGVHYAMTETSPDKRIKQALALMKLDSVADTEVTAQTLFDQIDKDAATMELYFFRYLGQHWRADIGLASINSQLDKIKKLPWPQSHKNQLTAILGFTFKNPEISNATLWQEALDACIALLQAPLVEADRATLLQAFSHCFNFKPLPPLNVVQNIIKYCLDLKKEFPAKNFADDITRPFINCLEHEGFEVIGTLQKRLKKIEATDAATLATTNAFTNVLQQKRSQLNDYPILTLLATLDEPELTAANIDLLLASFANLKSKTNPDFYELVLGLLNQFNIAKSKKLPTLAEIKTLVDAIAETPAAEQSEVCAKRDQETAIKDYLLGKTLLSADWTLGDGSIAALSDLITGALATAVKKRKVIIDRLPSMQATLLSYLKSAPDKLREQLEKSLIPLIESISNLCVTLQQEEPPPSFEDVITTLKLFEKSKRGLLDSVYPLPGIIGGGSTTGEFVLNLILTGQKKNTDNQTGRLAAMLLGKLNGELIDDINSFFDDEATSDPAHPLPKGTKNRDIIKELDPETAVAWLAEFNNTQSIAFLFEPELVGKAVVPALKKQLMLINTGDKTFDANILAAASVLNESLPADEMLEAYQTKIKGITDYLNALAKIRTRSDREFTTLYQTLQKEPFTRIEDFNQKTTLLNAFSKNLSEDEQVQYLDYLKTALNANSNASPQHIGRAIAGMTSVFDLKLDVPTQKVFFKLSLAHYLRSEGEFPLKALQDLKASSLPSEVKDDLQKQLVPILGRMSESDNPAVIGQVVAQTQEFLHDNPTLKDLCLNLLQRVSLKAITKDLNAYTQLLQKLAEVDKPENRNDLAYIIEKLAAQKKDESVTLPRLLEIAKKLSLEDIFLPEVGKVKALFANPPLPRADSLIMTLQSLDKKKLIEYCTHYDIDPFATIKGPRKLEEHFRTDRIKDALLSLKDLMHDCDFEPSLQLDLASQLTFIETLGSLKPSNPKLAKLTETSRHDLGVKARELLTAFRAKNVPNNKLKATQLELLAYLREIYFRTTGMFPTTTQMLMLLLALNDPSKNLLMSIKTGEGKSLITPMLAVLQWAEGGTVDICTANRTLMTRDYENSCKAFFDFLDIKSAAIQANSKAEDYKLGGINFSTIEDMSLFRLKVKELGLQHLIYEKDGKIHLVLDECDHMLLDETTLYKLVAEVESKEGVEDNPAAWIYPLAYQFIQLKDFRNNKEKVWDEDEEIEQLRAHLTRETSQSGDAEKQNYVLKTTKTQLKQWIDACCKAEKLVENKDFIIRSDEEGGNNSVCVPLFKSTPKPGCIFRDGVQQALQARLKLKIDKDPSIIASQSARGLIEFYQNTKGRLLGISGTPGDKVELESLATVLGTEAVGVAPYMGDKRIKHPPIFAFSDQELYKNIHDTIDSIKQPFAERQVVARKKPVGDDEYMELGKNIEEAHIAWTKTQTQPVMIICEDFDAAEKMKLDLEAHLQKDLETADKPGFTIQIVTGKETPAELDAIIKKAGTANTITIGTPMLARGIDVNPGVHPKGLFVIQAYTDSERITTQIAGRAARNGKVGEYLPVYKLSPPQGFFNKLLYYFFPWYYRRKCDQAVIAMQEKIKLQANIDRIYTQAIDKAQQSLMQQIDAWEGLLLELYQEHDGQAKLKKDLYKWREELLSNLTTIQETSVTQDTLDESIAKFKKALTKSWEELREKNWAKAATGAGAPEGNSLQELRIKYLMQVDINQECRIQSTLQENSLHIKGATETLVHQSIDAVIMDKAGAILRFAPPDDLTIRQELTLTRAKQVLPNLMAQLYTMAQDPIVSLLSETHPKGTPFLSQILKDSIAKFEHRNNADLVREKKQEIVAEYCSQRLDTMTKENIKEFLTSLKKPLLNKNQFVSKEDLVGLFKMQGIMLTFTTLYQESGLPASDEVSALEASFSKNIMGQLADYLIDEFAWVMKKPEPPHAYFEREVAKQAARELYGLAADLKTAANDEVKIHALYAALQKHLVILEDRYLFSISHTCPRTVIQTALTAISALTTAPHCSREYQANTHDTAVADYHLQKFRVELEDLKAGFAKKPDPILEHLHVSLHALAEKTDDNQSDAIEELLQLLDRYAGYPAYKPYLKTIKSLKSGLEESQQAMLTPQGLQQSAELKLLEKKASQFADLFTEPGKRAAKVSIQRGTDGIRSFIDVQLEGMQEIQDGFTGYQSAWLKTTVKENADLVAQKALFESKKEGLLKLTDDSAAGILSSKIRTQFERLFGLKALLALDWADQSVWNKLSDALPTDLQGQLTDIIELARSDWSQSINMKQLGLILGAEPIPVEVTAAVQLREKLLADIGAVQKLKHDLAQEITVTLPARRALIQARIDSDKTRLEDPNTGFLDAMKTKTKHAFAKPEAELAEVDQQIAVAIGKMKKLTQQETTLATQRGTINDELNQRRQTLVGTLITSTKQSLQTNYLSENTRQDLLDSYSKELDSREEKLKTLRTEEEGKMRYQTRRFFSTKELLDYEASRRKEEDAIPPAAVVPGGVPVPSM